MKPFILLTFLFLANATYGQYATDIIVAADGSGEYTSIQEAINDTKSYPDKRITLHVKPGIYKEKIEVYQWNSNVTFLGEDPSTTIITWDDHFNKIDKGRNSTFHTATLRVRGEGFRMENITVANSAGPVGQAIALYNEADRSVIKNCRLLGHQDVLLSDGLSRQYYNNCYIEGTTDFIFGGATVVFDSCTIHSKADSYITAASTPEHRNYGFVFLNCDLTADEGINRVFLGRPWRSFAKTAFVNCYMGSHISSEGWDNWSSEEKERTVSYVECANTGPGANTTHRVDWVNIIDSCNEADWNIDLILNSNLQAEFELVPKD